jgi:hypothetical protein
MKGEVMIEDMLIKLPTTTCPHCKQTHTYCEVCHPDSKEERVDNLQLAVLITNIEKRLFSAASIGIALLNDNEHAALSELLVLIRDLKDQIDSLKEMITPT